MATWRETVLLVAQHCWGDWIGGSVDLAWALTWIGSSADLAWALPGQEGLPKLHLGPLRTLALPHLEFILALQSELGLSSWTAED